jgi:hypothetical protein
MYINNGHTAIEKIATSLKGMEKAAFDVDWSSFTKTPKRMIPGALIGAGLGGLAGYGLGRVAAEEDDTATPVAGALTGALAGAGLGAGVGGLWEDYDKGMMLHKTRLLSRLQAREAFAESLGRSVAEQAKQRAIAKAQAPKWLNFPLGGRV